MVRQSALLAAMFILSGSSALSAPVAVFSPTGSSGIELVSNEDGRWSRCSANGRQAVTLTRDTTPPSSYFYFKLAPEAQAKLGPNVYLVVDFLDEGIGVIGAQFNTDKEPYAPAREVLVVDSGNWERAMICLEGAQFRGLQNGGADFRLSSSGSMTISRLEVYGEKPDLKLPTDRERAMKRASNTPKPQGMYYTLGNDANESTAPMYRFLGLTSIESYVTWETCEGKAEGEWDWSRWDRQVQVLKDNDLKWVPFLIVGPAYSTPNWFRASADHFPCRCLEHRTDSKIESLWSPHLPKWIDRFMAEFAKRYESTGVIESVLLGIQGDFGEAIYSVWGGGWTFDIPGEYHNHAGYWCDDPYALADFRKSVRKLYGTVEAVNKAWGTDFASLEDVDFPGRKEGLKAFQDQVPQGKPEVRRRWLDFVDWYRDAMTRFSDWWILTARKHFLNTPIYLCTGGDAEPRHGSNFAEQCRVAAKHKGGIRITNEASDYATNFVITRWVASAGKHYGAYYGFEPAGPEDERGVVARIYNATASGANQLHDYSPNLVDVKARTDAQRKHIKYLFHVNEPIVPVALWYPNVSLTLKWGGYLEKAAQFRSYSDFDYIDESMLRTNALDRSRVLVIVHGDIMETADAKRIAEWARKGGRVIVMDVPGFESVEGTSEPEEILAKAGMVRVSGWDGLAAELGKTLADLGLPVYGLEKNGVFGTQIGENRFLLLNTGNEDVQMEIKCGDTRTEVVAAAGTITDISTK